MLSFLLKLLLDNNFSQDLRCPVWRIGICGNCSGIGIRLVQMRTRIMNQLQALAMNEGQRAAEEKAVERARTEPSWKNFR